MKPSSSVTLSLHIDKTLLNYTGYPDYIFFYRCPLYLKGSSLFSFCWTKALSWPRDFSLSKLHDHTRHTKLGM